MRCQSCGRQSGWLRIRCPACRGRLVQWYIAAILLVLAAGYAGFVLIERFAT